MEDDKENGLPQPMTASGGLSSTPSDAELAPAIIFVDGQEFIRCQEGDDCRATFNETVKREGGEVALMVWKPRHLQQRRRLRGHRQYAPPLVLGLP